MTNKKWYAWLLLALFSIGSMQAQDTERGPKWLEKAVFYQIYPSSYMDTDGNGIGDIPGITAKLDYIQSLGANALWLNPVFKSGWFDGGYDVIDFYKVDPRFGDNTDLVTLVDEAHKRGIKVCLDLVAGHSSTQCPWFQEAQEKDRNQRYSNYYIWTDEISQKEKDLIAERKASPSPESSTIGQFVEADAPRGKYYMKNYFECQPALNYGYAHPDPNHPWEEPVTAPGPQAMRRELRNIMAFWMDKGVDGFRVDMARHLVKEDPGRVETIKLWQEMRQWFESNYPDNVLISEWSNPMQAIPAGFHIDFMIHFNVKGYNSLFFDPATPWGYWAKDNQSCYFDRSGKGSLHTFIKSFSEQYHTTKDKGYIAIPSANHDFQRPNIGTRNTLKQLKVTMAFYLTMPTIPFIYYGDEVAMKYQMDLPNTEGSNERAGTRTPMQWDTTANAGFSTAAEDKLYLPVDTDGGKLTVATQEKDANSMLHYVRQLVKLRQENPALGNTGTWELVSDVNQPYPMIYKRSLGDKAYLVVLNPSDKTVRAKIAKQGTDKPELVLGSTRDGSYKSYKKYDKVTVRGQSALIFLM